ncbi:AP-5 complex subunit beta-1 isoform X2 [Genypterus blacodes]|uniref:AP-5 complex subunit beta-1 isoform X2 n=1 Tax=Genypterus blacodes TaxID=154954 RepID=UPI003F774101
MDASWTERIAAFSRSPSAFLSGTTPEAFLAELLRELRDDRAGHKVKVLLLTPLCEYPGLLCPSDSLGEETGLELMSVLAHCPPRWVQLRSQLLLALTSVLLCSSCVTKRSAASLDFLELLLQMVQDSGDLQSDGAPLSLRAAACDCLRELESCCPGLLLQRLELLCGLRQRETSRLHQGLATLHTLVLRNAVYLLSKGAGAKDLKALLGGNASGAWEGEQSLRPVSSKDPPLLSPLLLGPMREVPTVQPGQDCKELRSVVSSLLEESYLLTPLCQAAALHRLTEVVAMVPGVPPAIFRAQLLRLLGTSEVCLLHCTLLMKAAFTDSLFSSEDEAFLLKRLVMFSQHPLLRSPQQLFFLDCILHFPENRPISEALPVLLTPRLAAALLPTMFDDSATVLARLNLLALVYLEEAEQGDGEEGRGPAYLYDFLTSLLGVVRSSGSREAAVTFFRAAFLFLCHFCHVESFSSGLTEQLSLLYLQHARLAPQLINMADRTQETLVESGWTAGLLGALQGAVTKATPGRLHLQDLSWHLKILARVAEEGEISQQATLDFLFSIAASTSPLCADGDWRLGNGVLEVCRRLLTHPSLDSLLIPLADILQHLVCYYGDTDVQDHARFYYSLLTTLSQEKLAGVLAQEVTEGGCRAKKRTLSSIVAASEGLTSTLTIHQADAPVLRLLGADRREAPQETHACEPQAGLPASCAPLDAYRAQFEAAGFASEINLDFLLSHTEDADPQFDQIFSVRLHFDLKDAHYEPLGDISVSCLFREKSSPPVRLKLRPRRPFPTTLRCSAIFTGQDGLTWHTPLPDVHVAFHQTFRPLPVPPAWGGDLTLGVFRGLWEEICSERQEEAEDAAAVSLFCCPLEDAALQALVDEHFLPYLVSERGDRDEYKVLLFLPPRSHLLMKIRPESDAAHFNIATDDWKLLPHISHFLLAITSSQPDVHR